MAKETGPNLPSEQIDGGVKENSSKLTLNSSDVAKILNNKGSAEKISETPFKDLKEGDIIYKIELPYVRNSKATKVEGIVKRIEFRPDESEYCGGSSIHYDVNGKIYIQYLRSSELSKSVAASGCSKIFTSKEARDRYFEEKTPKDIENINCGLEIIEEGEKKLKETRERMSKGQFLSLEEEISWIEDQYDHEYGSYEENAKMDAECKSKIEAAKRKWANK